MEKEKNALTTENSSLLSVEMKNQQKPKEKAIEWTDSQKAALELKADRILVSAAAGSGKSTVLTERIMRRVLSGNAEVTSLLAVTFTKEAALQLKQKIASALEKAVSENPSNKNLRRQLMQLPSASITTIHSFCYSLIKKNFQSLSLPSSLRIADDETVTLLKKRVMNEFVEFSYAGLFDKIPDFAVFSENFVNELDDSLCELFLDIYDRMRNHPDIFGKTYSYLNEDGGIDGTPFFEIIKNKLLVFTDYYGKLLSAGYSYIIKTPEYGEKFSEVWQDVLDYIKRIETAATSGKYLNLSEVLRSTPELKRIVIRKGKEEVCEYYRACLKDFLKECKEYSEKYFCFTAEDINMLGKSTSDISGKITAFLREFDMRFTEAKIKRNILDYGDLEHYAVKLLYDGNGNVSGLGEKISSSFTEIYIDEFQDVNPLQNSIFTALGKNCPIFMVGDIKQSIYNFRGAAPGIFSDYKRNFTEYSKADFFSGNVKDTEKLIVSDKSFSENRSGSDLSAENNQDSDNDKFADINSQKISNVKTDKQKNDITVFLSDNFRSESHITDFANTVSDAMFYSPDDDLYDFRIPYSENDRLTPHSTPTEEFSKVQIINVGKPAISDNTDENEDGGKERESEIEKEKSIVYEAEVVAEKIQKLCKNGENPSEIAILLRSPKEKSAYYERALKNRGVPVFSKKTEKLFDRPEIQLVLCILNACDNPYRDIFLAGALKSPVFGVTMSELVDMRASEKNSESLFEALLAYTKRTRFEKGEKFLNFILKIHNYSLKYPTHKVIWKIYGETSLLSLLGDADGVSEYVGAQIKENLILFYEFAETVSESGSGSLYSLTEKIRLLIETDSSPDAAKGKESGVKIMSVHASKGLEFRHCFLCGTSSKFNMDDTRKDVIFDPETGFGIRVKDELRLSSSDTPYRMALAARIELSQTEEEMRLLYVALTRAKIGLFITSASEKFDTLSAGCRLRSEFIHPYVFLNAPSYIKWILTAIFAGGKADGYEITEVTPAIGSSKEVVKNDFSDKNAVSEEMSENLREELEKRVNFVYPYMHMLTVPSKIAVSNLRTGILDADEESDGFTDISGCLENSENFDILSQYDQNGSNGYPFASVDVFPENAEFYGNAEHTEESSGGAGREDEYVDVFGTDTESAFPEWYKSEREKTDSGNVLNIATDNTSELTVPEFISGTVQNKAALRGTATHVFMQFCDFENVETNGVESETARLLENRFITATYAEIADRKAIEKFFSSDIYSEMKNAVTLEREYRFNVKLNASMFTDDPKKKELLKDESVFVQGVIDCYFRDKNGRITLVDYKTDYVPAEIRGNTEKENEFFVNRHSAQLTYYKTALEMLTGEKVSRTVIYSFSAARSIDI